MRGLRVTKNARRDLNHIWMYVAIESSAERADSLVAEITETIDLAAAFPGGGSDRSQFMPRLRSYPSGNYLVFFRSNAKLVEIIRVVHGARNLAAVFRPKKKRRR
jgi:toxin ParE1/3/4